MLNKNNGQFSFTCEKIRGMTAIKMYMFDWLMFETGQVSVL